MHKIQSFKTKNKLEIILTNIMRCLNTLINQKLLQIIAEKNHKDAKGHEQTIH